MTLKIDSVQTDAGNDLDTVASAAAAHAANTSNPHSVTKTQVGLGNVLDIAQAPQNSKYVVQGTADAGLTAAQFLGALASGIVKNTTTTGVLSIATPMVDYAPAKTILNTTVPQSSTSTTYANVTELTTPSLAAGTYRFLFIGLMQSTAATTGVGLRLGAGSATISTCLAKWALPLNANGTTLFYWYQQLSDTTDAVSSAIQTINTDYMAHGDGLFIVTSPGTVAIQLRSETGTSISIRAGSYLVLEKIA